MLKHRLKKIFDRAKNFPEECKMAVRKSREKRAGKSPGKDQSKSGDTVMKIRQVEFLFEARDEPSLSLAGEFNHWDGGASPMRRNPDGTWSVVLALLPGRYEFKPVAGGAWIENCPCEVRIEGGSFNLVLEPERVANPYGTTNLSIWVK